MKFTDYDHRYVRNRRKYTSVTTLIGMYKNKYDKKYWSNYKSYQKILGDNDFKALKRLYADNEGISDLRRFDYTDYNFFKFIDKTIPIDKALLNTLKKEVLDNWKHENEKSKVKGTKYHEFKENEAIESGFKINNFNNKKYETKTSINKKKSDKGVIITPTTENLYTLEDGFYPEMLIWNDKFRISGQADMVFIDTIDGVRYISIDDFKGLSLDTPIPTINGWKNIEDITTGDIIFDGNGYPTLVENVSEIHYNPCYKITFDNNSTLTCDHEHKWSISKRISTQNRENIEMTSEDIFNYYQNNNKKLAIEIHSMKTENAILPIDPYVLGLWLADGNRNYGTITCINNDIWDEVKRRGYNVSENHNESNDRSESRTVFSIYTELKQLNLLKNKHIPNLYFRSSFNQRLDLLRGYMDGDGYYNKSRNRYTMSTTSKQQAEDIQSLVCSLGYKCTIIPYKASGFNKTNISAYQLSFRMDKNPFLCRNKDIDMNYNNKNNFNYIKKIEKVDTVPTKCLAVSSESHTYLAGKSLIVTHNTNKKINTSNIFNKMKYPVGYLDDCEYNHYWLQVSFYAWMLEQFGFKVKDLGFTHINTPYKFDMARDEVNAILIDFNKDAYYDFL